jgi:hypothetical protein
MKTPSPVSIQSAIETYSRMPDKKKEDVKFWAIVALLMATLGGTFDIRRYVDVLKNMPEMQRKQESQGRAIEEIREVLKRNKIAGGKEDTDTATAIYSE